MACIFIQVCQSWLSGLNIKKVTIPEINTMGVRINRIKSTFNFSTALLLFAIIVVVFNIYLLGESILYEVEKYNTSPF